MVIGTVVIQPTNSNCPCEHLENIPNYKNKLLLVVAVMHHIEELFIIAIVTLSSLYAKKELMAGEKVLVRKTFPLGKQCPTPP